jgi:hypothetical protein
MPEATLCLLSDEEAPDPRREKHVGTIICWHPLFNYGDTNAPKISQEDFESRTWAVTVPIYEGDGLDILVPMLYANWSEGNPPIGYIYTTWVETGTLDSTRLLLAEEVRVYSLWLAGERFGYRLFNPTTGRRYSTVYGFNDKSKCFAAGRCEARQMGLDIISTVDMTER